MLLSDTEFELLLAQLAIIVTNSHALVFNCIWSDLGRVKNHMLTAGYQDIHPVYVHKPQQNAKGVNWIYSVDIMLIGYKKNIRACSLRFPSVNPLHRHNMHMMMSHNIGTKWKSTCDSEKDCNTTQKHTSVAERLGKILCPPGTTALVLGLGSGSEAIGFARAGVNVVGVERDGMQFQAASARLTFEAANAEQQHDLAQRENMQLAFLQSVTTRFTKLTMDNLRDESAASSPLSARPQKNTSSPAQKCVSCGNSTEGVDELVACCHNGCSAPPVHQACAEVCEKCSSYFCSTEHQSSHAC